MGILNIIKNELRLGLNKVESNKYNRLASKYHINGGFKRIYFYHIRKTGGTSLNHIFLSLGGESGNEVYSKLPNSPNLRIVVSDKIFVGWNKILIEEGNYYYAFSHLPKHKLNLPDNTFTITCLREPVSRVMSHYKQLIYYKNNNINHPCMKTEGEWLGDSFNYFLSNIPKEHLMRQLYMFSASLDPDEAFEAITNCNAFFFTEDFDSGIARLSQQLHISLESIHIRKSQVDVRIDPRVIESLKSKIQPEINLYSKLRKYECG